TRMGTVASEWKREGDKVTYIFTVPEQSTATAYLPDGVYELAGGTHTFTVG
ncbi:MAG: hypothetical protein IIW48_09350, partial [Clostridia bacterium]|nr:hypothetical protein [Clostridia bacterium]